MAWREDAMTRLAWWHIRDIDDFGLGNAYVRCMLCSITMCARHLQLVRVNAQIREAMAGDLSAAGFSTRMVPCNAVHCSEY